MKCLVCGGRIDHRESTTFTHTFSDGGETFHVIVADVPADVCDQCGETVYTPDVTDQLLQVVQRVREGRPAPQTVQVPLYSLAKSA